MSIFAEIGAQQWRETSECGRPGRDPRWWDGDADSDPVTTEYAIGICKHVCRVRTACLDDALAMGERFTIRGGFLPAERAQLRLGEIA